MAEIKITVSLEEFVSHLETKPGYARPEGKTKAELCQMLKWAYDTRRDWSDPAYGGGTFEQMVDAMAIDDFYHLHYVAIAYKADTA